MMKKQQDLAALFDLDGVVLDTESQYSIFWGNVGKRYYPEKEHFEELIKGQTLIQIYERYFHDMPERQNDITAALNEFEKEMSYNYIPGAREFIEELKRAGFKIAVVTSSNEQKMKNVFQDHPEFSTLFDKVLTAEMFAASKPNPDCFLLGANVFGTAIENCVVFEDSFHGLEAGNRAGMKVVGLATTNPADQIKDMADVVIHDFKNFHLKDVMQLLDA